MGTYAMIFDMVLKQYFMYLKSLLNSGRMNRLAIEISIILILKIVAIWLLWYFCFSNPPIAKTDRQQAVTRIILNNPSD